MILHMDEHGKVEGMNWHTLVSKTPLVGLGMKGGSLPNCSHLYNIIQKKGYIPNPNGTKVIFHHFPHVFEGHSGGYTIP